MPTSNSAFPASTATETSLVPEIYNEDPLDEPQAEKIHIRGVDDLKTSDITTFANDHFPDHEPSQRIEWVDDASANIVYASPEIALLAIQAFTSSPITSDEIIASPFTLRSTKTLATHPSAPLQVRLAKRGDKKKKGARDASRYYLLNPDQDPVQRMRNGFAEAGRRSRGSRGDYARRPFDDRELRRRRDNDAANGGDTNGDFSASMYDDNPEPAPETTNMAGGRGRDLFLRIDGRRKLNRSASPGRLSHTNSDSVDIEFSDDDDQPRHKPKGGKYRERSPLPSYSKLDPYPFPRDNTSKELFPAMESKTNGAKSNGGTLHSDRLGGSRELFSSPIIETRDPTARDLANKNAARKFKAELLASPRSQNHRRSNAMDAANVEDVNERFGRKTLNGEGRNAGVELLPEVSGLNIRGSAAADQGMSIRGSGGMSIKGAANVRELFPSQYNEGSGGGGGGNEGKELFSDKLRDNRRRVRAGDFH